MNCPICHLEIGYYAPVSLHDHVADHLEHIAKLSLPLPGVTSAGDYNDKNDQSVLLLASATEDLGLHPADSTSAQTPNSDISDNDNSSAKHLFEESSDGNETCRAEGIISREWHLRAINLSMTTLTETFMKARTALSWTPDGSDLSNSFLCTCKGQWFLVTKNRRGSEFHFSFRDFRGVKNLQERLDTALKSLGSQDVDFKTLSRAYETFMAPRVGDFITTRPFVCFCRAERPESLLVSCTSDCLASRIYHRACVGLGMLEDEGRLWQCPSCASNSGAIEYSTALTRIFSTCNLQCWRYSGTLTPFAAENLTLLSCDPSIPEWMIHHTRSQPQASRKMLEHNRPFFTELHRMLTADQVYIGCTMPAEDAEFYVVTLRMNPDDAKNVLGRPMPIPNDPTSAVEDFELPGYGRPGEKFFATGQLARHLGFVDSSVMLQQFPNLARTPPFRSVSSDISNDAEDPDEDRHPKRPRGSGEFVCGDCQRSFDRQRDLKYAMPSIPVLSYANVYGQPACSNTQP